MAASEPRNPQRNAQAAYWELEAELAPEAEEVWSLFCYERGAGGAECVSESPAAVTMRYPFASLHQQDPRLWLRAFRAGYPGAAPPSRVALRKRPVENWQAHWRAFFPPRPAGRRFLVCPPWAPAGRKAERGGRMTLIVEPGMGFGTGSHASTALALTLLEDFLQAGPAPAAMLDVGIGSGILSIGARLLGVREIWGLDIDGCVMPEVRRNFALNGQARPPRLVRGTPECLAGAFPLVVANLTAPILAAHRAALARITAVGGSLVMSGMLAGELEGVVELFQGQGWSLARSGEDGEWAACRLTRGNRTYEETMGWLP